MLTAAKPLRNLENALFASGGNGLFAEPGGRRLGRGERTQAAAPPGSGGQGAEPARSGGLCRRRRRVRATAPTRRCGATTPAVRKGRCRSAPQRRATSAAAIVSTPGKIARSGAPIWRCYTAATAIGPTPSPPITGASAISIIGSRRGGRLMARPRVSPPISIGWCTTAAFARRTRCGRRGEPTASPGDCAELGAWASVRGDGRYPLGASGATSAFHHRLDNAMRLAAQHAGGR